VVTDIIRQLLEAGVHFGHQTKRWNPKMAPYIFGQRSGIYIVNLEKTAAKLTEACDFLRDLASNGGTVLFVGTKKQAKDTIIAEAQRCNMFHVTERWLGGLLTNFTTIRSGVKRLKEIEKMLDESSGLKLIKKEQASLNKELSKLRKNLSGVVEMKKLPGAVFIIDPKKEETAVREANKLSIPVVALIDTNSDPDNIDFPVPGNDDAIRSIKLIASIVSDSIIEGRKAFSEGKDLKRLEAPEGKEEPAKPVEVSILDGDKSEDESRAKKKGTKVTKAKKP